MQPAAKRMAHANKDNQPIFKALLFHLTLLFTLSHYSFISLSSKFTVNHVAWSPCFTELLGVCSIKACILSMKAPKCVYPRNAAGCGSKWQKQLHHTNSGPKEEVLPNLKGTDPNKVKAPVHGSKRCMCAGCTTMTLACTFPSLLSL